MADQPENSEPNRHAAEAHSAASGTSLDDESSSLERRRTGHTRYGKRGRHRTHRYEALRRSQIRLAWSLATGTLVGLGLGLLFGNFIIGAGIGLTLGLAIGLLISG